MSLAMLDKMGVGPSVSVIDVGGGASFLVDRLVGRGFTDVTVLDVSGVALREARERAGGSVAWVEADLLRLVPTRRWGLWHDRAVFHFLTDEADRATYRGLLDAAVEPAGHVVIGTFADDGPESCSGLPVERYSADRLTDAIGPGFERLWSQREMHRTPSGVDQPFTWVVLRKQP
jgi:hypothetical protein